MTTRQTNAGSENSNEQLLLAVYTLWQPDFDKPPGRVKRPSDGTYVAFYENRHGEQWVLRLDRATGSGGLLGCETAWEGLEVREGVLLADLILSDEEAAWFRACLHAVMEEPPQQPLTLQEMLDAGKAAMLAGSPTG